MRLFTLILALVLAMIGGTSLAARRGPAASIRLALQRRASFHKAAARHVPKSSWELYLTSTRQSALQRRPLARRFRR